MTALGITFQKKGKQSLLYDRRYFSEQLIELYLVQGLFDSILLRL